MGLTRSILMLYDYLRFEIYQLERMVIVSIKNDEKDTQLSLKLFVVLTRTLESIQKQVIKDIKSRGLNKTEFGVLELLYNKGDHPIQKIGQRLLLASSSITYVVDKLEAKKLLERKSCPNDRRITHAGLTKSGIALMDEIFPEHKLVLHEIFGGLNPDEKESMILKLKKLGYHAENM